MTRMLRIIAVAALLCLPVVGLTQEPLTPREQALVQLYEELTRLSQQAQALERRIVRIEKLVDELAKDDPANAKP